MSIEMAIKAYEVLAETFGRSDLSGGNCGMAALAVLEKLRGEGVECSLGFATCDDAESHRDIIEGELPLYHVTVVVDGYHVDEFGSHSDADLMEWIQQVCRDPAGKIFVGLQPEDKAVTNAISWDTDWSIASSEFALVLEDVGLTEATSASLGSRLAG